jgi:hypothetical protein
MKRSVITLLVGLATAAAAGPALAQGHSQTRDGFWFSGGLGWGSLGCADCSERTGGMSGGLAVGGTIGRHILLGVGTTGWTRSENGASMTVGTLDARVRVYPSAKGGFFLTGGAGVGTVSVGLSGVGSGSETGFGLLLGLGYDIRVGQMLSLTPFWNGYAVQASDVDANVGQIGLSITVH